MNKERFSLKNLKFSSEILNLIFSTLYVSVFKHTRKYKKANKKKLIEDLKKLTEMFIWGERNNEDFFEFFGKKSKISYFCESQIMDGLFEIVESIKEREVIIQVIQTLSMLSYNLDLPQHISICVIKFRLYSLSYSSQRIY